MRRFLAAAAVLASWIATPARAADLELREESTGFRMRVGYGDARICVAFPLDKRGGDCAGLDLQRVRQPRSNQWMVFVHKDDWMLIVTMVVDAESRGREWTDAEARELRDTMIKQPANRGLAISPIEVRRIGGLQVMTVRAEGQQPDDQPWIERNDVIVGEHGVTHVSYAYIKSEASASEPASDFIASTYDATPATSTKRHLAFTVATLLAGAPLVVVAAAIASRKQKDA